MTTVAPASAGTHIDFDVVDYTIHGLFNQLVDCWRNNLMLVIKIIEPDKPRARGNKPIPTALHMRVCKEPVVLSSGWNMFELSDEAGRSATLALDLSQVANRAMKLSLSAT